MKYKDIVKEIKRKLRPFELVYESYEVFNKRKISDKSILTIIKHFMSGFSDKVAEVQNIALQSQMIMIWNDLDVLINQLKDINLILDNVNYEGSTFFISRKKVKESFQLMTETELAILDIMNELDIRLIDYKDAVDSALLGNSSKIINSIRKLLKQIENLWLIRQEAIQKFRFIS